MTYQGYMALANSEGETIELVNAARVKAYTDNLAPTIGLRGCDDCEGLPEALGEDYTTPEADNAPWYDPTVPDTANFYGVYPLAFDGVDDSTRTIESAELTGDGSVVVGSRYGGKDIRVSGMAFAKDEAALYEGMSWLDSALNGTEEGRCFGDRLNLYASCPPPQVLPPNFATPWTLPVPVTAAELGAWTTTSGTISAFPGNAGTDPGLRFDWDLGDSQKIACREITGLIPGEQYQLRMRLENFGDYYVRLGDDCANSRRNLAPNPRLLGWSWSSGGVADVEADISTGGPLGLGYRQSIATSANTGSPYSVLMPADEYIPVSAGDIYQISIYMMGIGSARLSVSFRNEAGSTIASDVRLQANVSLNSTWKRMSGVVVVPDDAATMEVFVASSVGVGVIQPNQEFGAANLLIEVPNFDIVRTNLQPDPRAVGPGSTSWSFGAGTGGAATSAFVTGAVDGPTLYGTTTSPTYKRNTVTTAPTGGSAGPFMNVTAAGDIPNPIPAGTRWTVGAWFRSNRTVTGTMQYRAINAASAAVDQFTETFTLTAGVWQYISGSKIAATNLVGVVTLQAFAQIGGPGGGAAIQVGDIYSTTGGLGVVGSADESYFDRFRPSSGLTAYMPGDGDLSNDVTHEVLADPEGSYFDGFLPGFRWEGPANDSASSSDVDIDYQIVSGWAGDPPTEPTVLDFIPRSESIFLSLTPTTLGDSVTLQALLIEEASIRRTARPGVVAFGSGNEFVPPSDGWTHLAPATMRVEWIAGENVQWDAVRTDAQAPSGSALTYTTAHGVQRTIFGLIPGRRYRLMVEFFEGYSVTDSSNLQTLSPFVTLSNTSGAIATYTENNDLTHYWTIEFTADATSSLLAFHPNSNKALGSFGLVIWSFDQYMVEEILPTDATEPRPGRFQERTMYEVKASQGPTLTNVRTSPCGVMGQVTFAVRAGNPFKYRSPVFAGGLPTGTSSVVSDTPCTADGQPQIVNFAYNPSLETNAVDWAGGGSNVTAGRSNIFGGRVGRYAFQVSAIQGSGRVSNIVAYYDALSVTTGPVPLPGETITISAYIRTIEPEYTGVYTWNIQVRMVGFPSMNFSGTINMAIAEPWYRFQQTVTLPDNVELELIEVNVSTPASITTGGFVQMDGLMIQRGDTATDPFDETFAGAEWTGTPNQSALAMVTPIADLTEDPDCPRPPLPPQPPEIDDSCVESPSSYNRTVVRISADTVPRNLTAYPIITLTAGEDPVRQARIRFWENPDDQNIDDLSPCDFDGEIIVSFLAAGATMVINGVTREATVSAPGFPDQNANHVLYGPDGGPVDWPELSGGIPYLVTLELDSSAPYTDTLMEVDLVVKD